MSGFYVCGEIILQLRNLQLSIQMWEVTKTKYIQMCVSYSKNAGHT